MKLNKPTTGDGPIMKTDDEKKNQKHIQKNEVRRAQKTYDYTMKKAFQSNVGADASEELRDLPLQLPIQNVTRAREKRILDISVE